MTTFHNIYETSEGYQFVGTDCRDRNESDVVAGKASGSWMRRVAVLRVRRKLPAALRVLVGAEA